MRSKKFMTGVILIVIAAFIFSILVVTAVSFYR